MNFRRFFGIAAFLLFLAVARPVSAVIITNVAPPLGGHGDLIKIFGNGFAPGGLHPTTFSADFNGTVSTTTPNAVVSDSEIDLTNVPTTATSGYIHISINGNPAQSPQQFVVIGTNSYATNFSPIYGASDTMVVVTGVHFQTGGVTNVMFNGVVSKKTAGTPFLKSDNEIDVTAPTGVTTGPLVLMSKFGTVHNFSTATNVISTATNFFVSPAVTSFSPASGRPNTNVVITGVNFTAASAVQFGPFNALSFIVSNNTTILAAVPTNASTAVITVSPPSGTILSPASSSLGFRMQPTIYAFSPAQGPANTTITINGAGLNEQTSHPTVTIGNANVTAFGTITPTVLSFNVPATAASGLLTITTTNGSIVGTQVFYMPAVLSSFTPAIVAAGIQVQINGNSFTNASAVTFNGIPSTDFAVTNNTIIGAKAPPGVTSGILSVTTPFGTTNSTALFYVAPTISSFTPTHGLSGATITITGTSFTNASAVLFNGAAASSFVVSNNTTLSAVVPGGATTGKITVTAPGGSGQSTADFTIDTADVGVTMSAAPDPVFLGSNLVYKIVVTNNGPVIALNVRLADSLPQFAKLKSAATTQGTLDTSGNPIFGSFGDIANNGSATVTLTVTPTATGPITNSATVETDSLDPNPANDSAQLVTTVWPLPFLSIANLTSNNLVQISWPAPLSGFTLQFRTDLSPGITWTNDTSARAINGTNISVIETNIGTPRFFRLTN